MEQLVAALVIAPSNEILHKLTVILLEERHSNLSSFVSESFQSICNLEQWAWQVLSRDSRQWKDDEQDYFDLFCALASFNLELALSTYRTSTKISILFPQTIDTINGVFNQIERRSDENDRFITVISLWIDVLSYLIHIDTQFQLSPVNIYINERIENDFIYTDEFKAYLDQLHQSSPSLTIKQLFYLKTCILSFNVNLYFTDESSRDKPEKFMQHLGNDHRDILIKHSFTVAEWSKELLTCITHLLSVISTCCWSTDTINDPIQLFDTSEVTTFHEYIKALIRILDYKPFHGKITAQWCNDETILIDAIIRLLAYFLEQDDIVCFLRSETHLSDILLTMNMMTSNNRIHLITYRLLADILTDEQVKKLKISRQISEKYFDCLEEAWLSPSQTYENIPIQKLLLGYLILAKNDTIQTITADSPKFSLLIDMVDRYPIVFNILWTLSFSVRMQERLRSDDNFFEKFTHAEKTCEDEQMHKILLGIQWNLDYERAPSKENHAESFDMMISYSHDDKMICKQIYEELINAGFRVWIDFDHMHGDAMDAMAQAIERSRTIIICMSEHYRRSNYCRAEAQYAFKCQLKIVPILVQNYYKPEGWLAFLIGELLYIDFNKYEFSIAMQKLLDELKAPTLAVLDSLVVRMPIQNVTNIVLAAFPSSLPDNMNDWTQDHVKQWLTQNNLTQLSRLLTKCNGSSLINLNKLLINDQSQQQVTMLQEESIKRTGQELSLMEISRLQSLIQQQLNVNNKKWYSSVCCRMM